MPQYWVVVDRENLAVGEKLKKLDPSITIMEAREAVKKAGPNAKLLTEVPDPVEVSQRAEAGIFEGHDMSKPGLMGLGIDTYKALRGMKPPTVEKGNPDPTGGFSGA